MIYVMYQELHSQVFLFNRFMGELLAAAAPLAFDDIGIRVAVVHDLVHLAGAQVPEHEHPVYELAWIRSGAMTYVIDEVRMENTGENFRMVLIPPATLHHRFSMEEVSVIRSAELQFSPHSPQAAELLAALPERIRECGFALSPSPGVRARLAGLDDCVASGGRIDRKIAELLLYGSILELLRGFLAGPDRVPEVSRPAPAARPELIKYICMLIEDRINGAVDRQDFIRMSGVGERQFNRIFQSETGMTLNAYIISRRLANAEQMLRAGAMVGEVAKTLGFSSPSYFIAFFRKYRGMTPRKFQEMSEN